MCLILWSKKFVLLSVLPWVIILGPIFLLAEIKKAECNDIGRFFTEYSTDHGQKTESKTENRKIYGQIDQINEPKWRERRPAISIFSSPIRLFLLSAKRCSRPFYFRPKTKNKNKNKKN